MRRLLQIVATAVALLLSPQMVRAQGVYLYAPYGSYYAGWSWAGTYQTGQIYNLNSPVYGVDEIEPQMPGGCYDVYDGPFDPSLPADNWVYRGCGTEYVGYLDVWTVIVYNYDVPPIPTNPPSSDPNGGGSGGGSGGNEGGPIAGFLGAYLNEQYPDTAITIPPDSTLIRDFDYPGTGNVLWYGDQTLKDLTRTLRSMSPSIDSALTSIQASLQGAGPLMRVYIVRGDFSAVSSNNPATINRISYSNGDKAVYIAIDENKIAGLNTEVSTGLHVPGDVDMTTIIAHEIYAHAVPYFTDGSTCPDYGGPNSCAVTRENVIRGQIGRNPRQF